MTKTQMAENTCPGDAELAAMNARGVTLNGNPARIGLSREKMRDGNPFARVYFLSGQVECGADWCWFAVRSVVAAGGAFKA